MLNARPWYLAAVAGVLLSAGLVVACRDDKPTQPNMQALAQAPAKVYTPQELRAANPYTWAGRLHNTILRSFLIERRGPGSREDACRRVAEKLTQADIAAGGPALTPAVREGIRRGLFGSPVCGRVRNAAYHGVTYYAAAEDTVWMYPSSAAEDTMYAIIGDAGQATSSSNLAAILSPHFTASQSMPFPDADAVQVVISTLQESYEEHGPEPANYAVNLDLEIEYLESCENDPESMEGVDYQAGEDTYRCTDGQWNQIGNFRRGAGAPMFQLASFAPIPAAQSCSNTADELHDMVMVADGLGVAAGGLLGLRIFGKFGTNPFAIAGILATAVAAGAGASIAEKGWQAWKLRAC